MNCEYCGSRVFETDRVCDRCGAPSGVRSSSKQQDCFGDFIKLIEENEPQERATDRSRKQDLIHFASMYLTDRDFLETIKE